MAELFDKFLATPTSTKVALLILLLGFVAGGWWVLFYDDVLTSLASEHRRTPQLNRTLTEEQEIEKNLVRFQDEITRLQRARDKMRDRLPENAEVAALLQQIHSQAKVVGLEIQRFERAPNESAELYAKIPVTMTLKGSFHQIATFFYYLGQLTRIVNVENIALKAPDRDGGSNLIEAVCDATTFMYLPPPNTRTPAKRKRGG